MKKDKNIKNLSIHLANNHQIIDLPKGEMKKSKTFHFKQ